MSETSHQGAHANVFNVLRSPAYAPKLIAGLQVETLRHEVPDVFEALLALSHQIDWFHRKSRATFSDNESRTLSNVELIYSTSVLTRPMLNKLEAGSKILRRHERQAGMPVARLLQQAVVHVKRNTLGQHP